MITLPKSNIGRGLFYFCMQFSSYAILVANGRAYMQGSYFWTATTDLIFATQNFFFIRKLAKDSNEELHGPSLIGYVLGGVLGSLFAIWVTKYVYGQ
jgi:hypothetical protein